MKTVASFAIGCKVNQVESEAVAEAFALRGYDVVDVDQTADVYVINTCTVTNLGDKKSRQIIRRVKRQNPEAVVVVTGCYAQTAAEEIKKIDGVNIIIGTKGRNEIVDSVEKYSAEQGIIDNVSTIMKEHYFEPISINKLKGRCRAYIKIQDGCNQFCSYCIIPYARGPVRSRKENEILEEVKSLGANGFKEIVLTGIHVASYGKDLEGVTLINLVEKISQIPEIERIRFSSIEPNIITESFMEQLNNIEKVCHHFHLSLQSGCDKTLKAMNRKYTSSQYKNAVEIIRKYWNDVAITTDIIVGFPAETEEDFQTCAAFAKEIEFSKIHVFPFSPKKGTPAAKMDCQIDGTTKTERSKALIEISEKMSQNFVENFIGNEVSVLFEQEVESNIYEGHTSNYITVRVFSNENLKNQIRNIKITNSNKDMLTGEIVS